MENTTINDNFLRLIIDDAKYDFIIADATTRGIYIDRKDALLSDGTKSGTIVTYTDGENPQYTYLRSSMLAYTSINLLSTIYRFPKSALRVTTDSFYIDVKDEDVVAEFTNFDETWGSWRIRKDLMLDYSRSVDVTIENNYLKNN